MAQFVFAERCNCVKGRPFVSGAFPIYTTSAQAAGELFHHIRELNRPVVQVPYWAIHLDNKHILSVIS